ncbi:MAG: hypothetical protein ABEJ05_10145 [Haloglomus sp.]
MTTLGDLVERSLSASTRAEFESRVDDQARFLREEIGRGQLDNDGFAVGLELEVYAVDDDGRLADLPESVFGTCNKELGVHNAELNTDPDPFTTDGIEAQAAAIREQWATARDAASEVGRDLVLDSMWTIPPDEGGVEYLSATHEEEGVTVPSNMRLDPRYCAIDRHCIELAGGPITFDVPGATVEFPSILFESLATSIQPHLQIPTAEQLPAYYNTALRTLGPVLALATNSPFLPPDFYDVDDPESLLTETHHELRIAAFEQSVNHTDPPKVRVPADLDDATDVVAHVREDPVMAPFLSEWLAEDGERVDETPDCFADNIPEFDHKRSTYWRWLRCVVGGDPVSDVSDERSLRLEYRPVPTQPAITDVVGIQCLVGGLLRGLVDADHPITDLPWEDARASFYDVAANGLDADIAWVTADGERTSDREVVYDEVFAYARRGLDAQGIDQATVTRYLDPIERRWDARTTPSRWKIERVRDRLADGAELETAITDMQREYVRLSREQDSFAAWL